MRRPLWWLLAALPAVLLVGAAAFVFVRTQHSLDREKTVVGREGLFPFSLRTLGPPENPRFEAIASPATYLSGAFYRGKLYVTGPSGLYIYGSKDGTETTLLKTYRVGLDLPPAPLGQIVAGRLRGASEPELIIATADAGVLLFTANGPDGEGSFRQILPADPGARDITALLPLATGDLLIGTRRLGLLVYRGGNTDNALQVFHPQLASLSVTALAASADGFWLGTRNQGLRHWHGGEVDAFTASPGPASAGTAQNAASSSLPDDQIDAIAVQDRRVFVGTPLGVEEFIDGRPARVLARDLFASALFADDKSLTVGSIDQGIRRVSLQVERPSVAALANDSDSSSGPALQFLRPADPDRSRLFAVMRDELRQQSGDGAWLPFNANPPGTGRKANLLTDGNIAALAFDPNGHLWIGYFDRGLDIVSADGERLDHREDSHLFCVNRIVLDPRRKTMAVATANGLVLFDTQGRPHQVLTRRDGLISDHITDIAFNGESMALATPAGLTFMDAAGTRSIYAFQGLVNNHVYALGTRPQSDELMAGTLGGVSDLFHESVRRNLTVSNSGLRHNWVTAIVPVTGADPAESWMVGTYGAGVMRLDKDGRFYPLEGVTRPMNVNPNAMLVTRAHVFAGTLGSGLWVCARATGHWHEIDAGLPSSNVTAIAEENGTIYVGTDNGLVRIEERRLD